MTREITATTNGADSDKCARDRADSTAASAWDDESRERLSASAADHAPDDVQRAGAELREQDAGGPCRRSSGVRNTGAHFRRDGYASALLRHRQRMAICRTDIRN